MRRTWYSGKMLDASTIEAIIFGGTVLGESGRLDAGLRIGQLVMELGDPMLVDPSSLPPQTDLVALAALTCPAVEQARYRLVHHHRALELLAANTACEVAGLVNCGFGAADAMIACGQAAWQGIPLVDVTIHPRSLSSPARALLERWPHDGPPMNMAIVGSDTQTGQPLEIFVRGSAPLLASVLDQAVAGSDGNLALAIGPLPCGWVNEQGVAHLIGRSMTVGQVMMDVADDGGWAVANALGKVLGGQVIGFAEIIEVLRQDSGTETTIAIRLQDESNRPLELVGSRCYMRLTMAGQQIASFPDLILTLGAKGTPLNADEISEGQEVYVVTVSGTEPSIAGRQRSEGGEEG